MGLCPGLQGGIRTTLTHTVLLLSLLFYPSHDPSLSLSPFFLTPIFLSTSLFPAISFPSLPSALLHLLICMILAVISGGTVIKQNKGIAL